MKMTIDEAIIFFESKDNMDYLNDGNRWKQVANWLKELKHHRASIRSNGEMTVRELIWRLLELDVDKPIYLMDQDMYSQQIRINADAEGYFITGGEGYFDDKEC